MPASSLEAWLQSRVKDVPGESALSAAKLLAEGYGVPFLARYRKDETGGLDEAELRRVVAAREVFERMEARRQTLLEAAERHKKRTPEFEERVAAAVDLATLEDLGLPFRKKKGETLAAREAGLEPLADWIWNTGHGTEAPQEGQTLELWAFTFRNPEKGVIEAAQAVAGARALLVERLAEDPDLRARVRREVFAHGVVRAEKTDKAKPGGKHEAVYTLAEKAKALREPDHVHRVFALRRAANEGDLKLKVTAPDDDPAVMTGLDEAFRTRALTVDDAPGAEVLRDAAREALHEHVWVDMSAELLQSVREDADRTAIRPLAEGYRRRLLAPPLGPKPVLGLHPTRDGGVLALLDGAGHFVKGARLALGEAAAAEARETLVALAREGGVAGLAVGDGTAGRERAQFAETALREAGLPAVVVQVLSEAAATAWRASDDAKAELPDADPETRAAVALGRRLQDPLLELARVEPRALAEGGYLHEVSQRLLAKRLDQTLESCLHDVGIEVNRVSLRPLARMAGLSEEKAYALLARRREQGPFATRADLREGDLLDERAFREAAPFLRIPTSTQFLDATRIHPERYLALEACARRLGTPLAELRGDAASALADDVELKEAVGARTLLDLVGELRSPGLDPRGPFVPFRYRADVRRLEDLKPGMVCPGLVTNTTSFGVFVDLGVPHDGLVHVSQLAPAPGDKAAALLLPGDRVEVRVVKVDLAKGQISLSMRGLVPRASEPPRPARPRPRPAGDATARGERSGRGPRPGGRPSGPRPARAGSPSAGASDGAPPPAEALPSARPGGRDRGPGRGPKPERAGGSSRPSPRPERSTRADRPERVERRGDRPPASESSRPGPRPAFNNPFAVLAALKEPKKG